MKGLGSLLRHVASAALSTSFKEYAHGKYFASQVPLAQGNFSMGSY